MNQHQRRHAGSFWPAYAPVVTWTLICAYTAIGAGLVLQAGRFANTPSYHNLLASCPAWAWGAAYLLAAALLVAWRRNPGCRWLGPAAHAYTAVLTLWWLGGFVIRYGTDDGTTIVNVVSWSVFLSLVARSWQGIDDDKGG